MLIDSPPELHRRTDVDRHAMRTVVLVSPYFPPSTLAGVHRARHLGKHLPAAGWTPIVLCARETDYTERLDPNLAKLVSTSVEIVKFGTLPARLMRRLGIGDISLRGCLQLKQMLFGLLSKRPVDAVLITGGPYYPMLLASEIKRRFGVPVVLDFQDPWVSAWGATQPVLSKAGMAHRLATLLEPRALRGAAFVTSVSETQNAEMAARYSWFDPSRMAAIPIGGDPDDFEAMVAGGMGDGSRYLDAGFVNLSYVGTFLPRSELLVRTLLRAFVSLRQRQPALAARIRLNFVGTSNQPNGDTKFYVRPIAESMGVGEAVREIPQRLPFLEALGIVAQSHGLLLIGSDEPHYTASKIYPALMSGRPFLSLFHRASSAHSILSSAGGGRTLAFGTIAELETLTDGIADGLQTLVLTPGALGTVDPAAYEPYEARNIAKRFAEVFDRVAAGKDVRA